jgi:VWFA-related protein
MQFVPKRVTAALIFVTTGVLAVTAQDVVFRTSVDLLTVDATVLDREGRPTTDLGADDFVIKIDGQPRRIVSAQFVSQQVNGRVQASLFARHFSSNENADAGRLVVVAVDEAHIRRLEGRSALHAASRFIDELDPVDRVAVTGLGRSGAIQFTRDRVALKQRLDALGGQSDPVFLTFNLGLSEAMEIADGGRARLDEVVLRECGRRRTEFTSAARAVDDSVGGGRDACPEQLEGEARAVSQHARTQARISLGALEALVASLKTLDGPKTIILLSEGIVLDPRSFDLSNLAVSAKEARVSIYVLHMETPLFEAAQDRTSPTLLRDVQLRGEGLHRVAGATRGAVYRLVGSDPKPFERIATELSGYYLLAVEAGAQDRDGRVHRVDVALAKNTGNLIRARSAFRMPPVAPSPRTRQQELVDLLRGTRAATELPVRVATYTYAGPDSRLRVVVSTEADAAAGPASQVLIGYVLTDATGVIASSGAQLAVGGRHAFSSLVTPGTYSLRVAGIDPLDRRGLVERPFTAAIETHGALRLSDLILAPTPSAPTMPLEPVVHRIRTPRITANMEIYAAGAEALQDLQVIFQVNADSGSVTPLTFPAALVRGDGGLVVARGVLALDGLPRGGYVTQARVLRSGKDVARVSRPFTYEP